VPVKGDPLSWGFDSGGGGRRKAVFIDLGEFPHDPNLPLGLQAQDYVLERGRATGVEHLVAFDKDGEVVAHGKGIDSEIGSPDRLIDLAKSPDAGLVVHHNHPGNTSLSPRDLAVAAAPGVKSVWAHGHGGAVYRGEVRPEVKAAFARDPEHASRVMLEAGIETLRTADMILDIADGRISDRAAAAMRSHLANIILRDAGLIHYKTNVDISLLIEQLGLQPYIDAAAADLHRRVFDGREEFAPAADDRRAGQVHPPSPGELGTRLEANEGAAPD
jgi:hypothetical protein